MHQQQARTPVTEQALAPASPRQPATPDKPKELKPTRKVMAAISAMVWQGLKRADAAQAAGLKEHSLYVALRLPHVKQAYLRELEVLRTSERARNFHALLEVRDQTDNQQARVNAVKVLEEQEHGNERKSSAPTPGITIVIAAENAKAAVQVNHTQSPDSVWPHKPDADR